MLFNFRDIPRLFTFVFNDQQIAAECRTLVRVLSDRSFEDIESEPNIRFQVAKHHSATTSGGRSSARVMTSRVIVEMIRISFVGLFSKFIIYIMP
ncbi:unnamed protein product [Soboliphyme baturini]|uniref:Uncharacterized protein n=1 Tax=Soboliphyme baturini TaxID=241478 RepID=A0A183IN41_9BILA|nr:unnamed protein product [Soboliphyme baturini]